MRGRTHAAAGVLIGLALATNGQPLGGMMMGALGGLGALIPDIDHPRSMIGRRTGPIGNALRLAVNHRGVSHSGVAAAIIILVALWVPAAWRPYTLAASLGYASHLCLDALTGAGIPLFWPIKHRFTLLPLRTGGVVEGILFILLLLAVVYVVIEKQILPFLGVYLL